MFYTGFNPIIELGIQGGALITSVLISPVIVYNVKRKLFKDKETKFRKLFGIDFLSNFLFLTFLILISALISWWGVNYLLPILMLLLIYLLIDRNFYKRLGLDSSSLFWITFISRIPILLSMYYIIIFYFAPRHW